MFEEPTDSKLRRYRLGAILALSATALGGRAHGSTVMPPGETIQTARASGMAGTGVAVADDYGAIFINPAGIGNQDDAKKTLRGLELPNVTLGANLASIRLFKTYSRAKSDGAAAVEKEMMADDNDVLFARATIFPYITIRRFQLGLLIDGQASSYRAERDYINSDGERVTGKITTQERSQAAAVAGFSIPYLNSGSSFGVTARYSVRTSNTATARVIHNEPHRDGDTLVDGTNRTRGLGVDLGILLRSKNPYVPLFGATLRDLGGSYYRGLTSKDTMEVDRTNLSAALTFDPFSQSRSVIRALATVEAHHINDGRLAGDEKLRLGGEARIGGTAQQALIALRVGHNLAGFSYGASLDALFLKLEFGSVVENAKGEDGDKPDRRNFTRLGVDLGL